MLFLAPDSPRWTLHGQAGTAEYLDQKCLALDGGAATVKDFVLRDGTIDSTLQLRRSADFSESSFASRKTKRTPSGCISASTSRDCPMPCNTPPVLNTGLNWQIYNGPGFTGAVDIPQDAWFHLRLEITGAQAKLYAQNMKNPALVMSDLKSGVQKGRWRWRC